MPEIEQGLSEASGYKSDVKVSFTPHLINMSRLVVIICQE